jgi:hypothetical protein
MLFLMKKTLIPLLIIWCLLSIPKAHAINIADIIKKGAIGGTFILLAYEGMRDINQTEDAKKGKLAIYHDTLARNYQSFLDKVGTKKGLVALGVATIGTVLLTHRTNVFNTPLAQNAVYLITPK